jgi:hypothetical protein
LFVAQFDVVRDLVRDGHPAPRAAQLNAERMRIIHDTSTRPRAPTTSPEPAS